VEKKETAVVLDGRPIEVILHPPSGARRSWYVYWNGLVPSKSTGHTDYHQAVVAAEHMLKEWKAGGTGERPRPTDSVLTDEEFEKVQRTHFATSGQKGPRAAKRAKKSLKECIAAMRAFQSLSGLSAIAAATPDDCAAFQRKAVLLPKNWRHKYPNSRPDPELLSPSTVYKWSNTLMAAFNRVKTGKKCVRGVVDEGKLLSRNPWEEFKWLVKRRERPIRQFSAEELVSLLDYLADGWGGVTIAATFAKMLLWSSLRREEVAGLTWQQHRAIHG
jgi:hypothetical protein